MVKNSRVEEVLKEPGTEKDDSLLREPPLRPPCMLLDHAQMLEGLLLAQLSIQILEAGKLASGCWVGGGVGLAKQPVAYPKLPFNGIPQNPEMPGHGIQGQLCIRQRGALPHHRIDGNHHHLHVLHVCPILPVDLVASKQSPHFTSAERS